MLWGALADLELLTRRGLELRSLWCGVELDRLGGGGKDVEGGRGEAIEKNCVWMEALPSLYALRRVRGDSVAMC